jgi:light-regulated signal transduction histidine kinase (bacteriophytochrome)
VDGERELDANYEEFLYAAVHDLRAPLNQVHALTTLLGRRHKDKLDAEGRVLCGHIEAAAERALAVVDALHAYAQMGEPVALEDVDGNSILRAAILNLEDQILIQSAEISHDPLPRLRVDRRKLIALFRELLANALKFRSAEPARIRITVCASGETCMLSFRDNGVGIPPAKAEDVFRPFKRLHGHEHPGTGMGLAIGRRIAQMHRGRLWIEPAAGQGTDFRLTLPLA